MNKKVLVLFAHPAQDQSEVNTPMFREALRLKHDNISCVDLYAEYPTHNIDIAVEQQRLLEHDVVIFLFPFYWYSTPAILKDWMDLVLEYNFAYGKEGTALQGKYLLPVLSAGGGEQAYQQDGYNHFTLRELLRPLEQTALMCKMRFLAPFAIFGSRTAAEEQRVNQHIDQFRALLSSLATGRFDFEKAQSADLLAHHFDDIVKQ